VFGVIVSLFGLERDAPEKELSQSTIIHNLPEQAAK